MTLILNGTDNSATTPAVTGTDTDTGVYYPAANQVAIATSGTQAMLANASQGVQFANAIGVGATTPTTSGAGITFPATQSASSNANTLDDYEEGTFNSTDLSGAGLTFVTSVGTYVKIGQLVYFQIKLLYPSTASSATTLISLPFPVFDNGQTYPQGAVGSNGNSFASLVFGYNNTATASFSGIGSASNTIATNTNLSSANLNINIVYRTSS